MGIIVDLIIIALIAVSIFLGYKKGLITLALSLCTFVIAVLVTLILYQPISNTVINVSRIDETIENAILEKANDIMKEEENEFKNTIIEEAKQGLLPETARRISITIVKGGVFLILFVLSKIALKFVTALANFIAKLPIIKQFNSLGGIIYGLLRGLIIVYVALLIINIVGQVNPQNKVSLSVKESTIGKTMSENNAVEVLFKK